jgi:hypothetical protein
MMFTAAAALVLAVSAGCGDDDSTTMRAVRADTAADGGDSDAGSAARVLVGAVDDSDIALGAVVAGDRARMFFCGGPSSYARATHWLQLELAGDGSFAQVEDDGFEVAGQVRGDRVTGELDRPGDAPAAFSAELARAGTLAGLYDGQDDCGKLGLIVREGASGGPVRAQGACVGAGRAAQQVNPILPIGLDADGSIPVELITAAGTRSASVRAVTAP